MKCVEVGCDSKVSGKDSWRCDKHEYAYYAHAFTKEHTLPDDEVVADG